MSQVLPKGEKLFIATPYFSLKLEMANF